MATSVDLAVPYPSQRIGAAGLTQQQVAERLGRPQIYIFRVERGLQVTVVELIEFGTALEFDPAAALRRVVKAAKQ